MLFLKDGFTFIKVTLLIKQLELFSRVSKGGILM